MLRDAGIRLRDFTPELRAEVTADNQRFVDSFRVSVGPTGQATFDYKQHGGRHVVQADDVVFPTHWGERGGDSVYAQGAVGQVAKARYAQDFAEVDDPGALDWSFHAVDAYEGEIVVFREGQDYLLVRIDQVRCGPTRGHDRYELQMTYEVRRRARD